MREFLTGGVPVGRGENPGLADGSLPGPWSPPPDSSLQGRHGPAQVQRISSLWLKFVLGVAVLLLGGCGSGPQGVEAEEGPHPVQLGRADLRLELAVTPAERRRGLQQRDFLPPDQGMAFFYGRPQRARFWMRNTPLPLDIGFFTADGVLREVYPLHPHTEVPVRSVREDIALAVEVNQGWFAAEGIFPGDRIDRQALWRALRAEGHDPSRFALLTEAGEGS